MLAFLSKKYVSDASYIEELKKKKLLKWALTYSKSQSGKVPSLPR